MLGCALQLACHRLLLLLDLRCDLVQVRCQPIPCPGDLDLDDRCSLFVVVGAEFLVSDGCGAFWED